jgi:aminoglycoside phosphotransferase (APT) family kinase protein
MAVTDQQRRALPSAITMWLAEQGVRVVDPIEVSQISGGQSNLTYRIIDAAGQRFVLRRPPTAGVLDTAHSMSREWRFISGLVGTGVAVPRPIAYCEDPSVLGAVFYVMEHVDGLVAHTADDARALDMSARSVVSADIAATLGQLHSVNAEAVGLSDMGRGGDYVARQLRRWHGQWDKTRAVAGLDLPAVDEGHRVLLSAMPQQRAVSVVHGDYRLGNVVIGPDGRIRAILDWELATLGDPRADLGWLLLSWNEPGETRVANPAGAAPSTLPGFGTRVALLEAYTNEAGEAAATDIDYFVAFAAWRWACISAGVYARYQAGVMGAESGDLEVILAAVKDHAHFALELIAGGHTGR